MDHRAAARAQRCCAGDGTGDLSGRPARRATCQLRMEYHQAMADFGLTTAPADRTILQLHPGESCWPRPWRFPISTACSAPTTTWRWGPAAMPGQVDPVPQQMAIAGSNALDIGPRRMTPKLASIVNPPRDHRSRSHHAAGPPRRPAAGDQGAGHRLLPMRGKPLADPRPSWRV